MVDVEIAELVGCAAGGLEGFFQGTSGVCVGGEERGEEAVEEGVPGVLCAEDADGVDGYWESCVFGDLLTAC